MSLADKPRISNPEPKKSRIKPTRNISGHVRGLVSQVRNYVWEYEIDKEKTKEKGEAVWRKPAQSPRTTPPRKFKWREEGGHWKRNLPLWGTFGEAIGAYEENEDLQGVGSLVEPDRTIEVDGENLYPVWLDFDRCRNHQTGEIDPRVMYEIEKLDTYTEISPSGEGLRCIGWGKRHPDSKTFFDIEDHDVEIYGGGVGGRHLITFTGVPLEGYDKPIRNIQDWIDETVPVHERDPEDQTVTPEPLDLSDQEILRVMLSSKDGRLMERFMTGDENLWKGTRYKSRSNADQGFFRKLAFYTRGDQERMKRIALSSGMRRKKWDRTGYLDELCTKGIKKCGGKFYDPEYSSKEEIVEGLFRVWMGLKDYKLRRSFGALLARVNSLGWYSREGFVVRAHGQDHVVPEEGLLV